MEKKKSIILLSSLSLILILAVLPMAGACAKPAPAKPIELSIASPWPATHFLNTEMWTSWIQRVEEGTNGRVKCTLHPGGSLLKGKEMYEGVVEGTADICDGVFAYYPGRFPAMEVLELPGIIFNSPEVSTRVAWDFYQKFKPAALSEVKILFLHCNGPGDLWSKTPVRSLEDIQGMEVRATGTSAKALKALGAVPVAMPKAETYLALQKGIVKADISNAMALKAFKEAEVTDYLTMTPFIYNAVFFFAVNLDKWNSLPKEIQKVMEKVGEETMAACATGWEIERVKGIEWAISETGMEVIYLSDEEMARWVALLKPVQDEYIAAMAAKGLPGKEYVDYAIELAEKYNKIYPPVKGY